MSDVVSAVIALINPGDPRPVLAPAIGLTLRLLQEELLALHAAEVARLVVAKAHEVEGIVPAHELVARLDVD